MVGNPFVGAPRRQLCEAYDELLQLILLGDLDFDRLALDFHRLLDEHGQSPALTPSMDRFLLLEIAARHGTRVADHCLDRTRVDGIRAWVGYHARRLRAGYSLCLLCHCVEGQCDLWCCHGQCLAGALTWAVDRVLPLEPPVLPIALGLLSLPLVQALTPEVESCPSLGDWPLAAVPNLPNGRPGLLP